MLEELNIKDFALIENDFLEFEKGFTVLSGETGAGKSILIGALSFLLGGKAEVSQIRAGKNEASVSGTFVLPSTITVRQLSEDDEPLNALEWLDQHGIQTENNRVLLRRFIRDTGKSGAWINDTPVTRGDLAASILGNDFTTVADRGHIMYRHTCLPLTGSLDSLMDMVAPHALAAIFGQ